MSEYNENETGEIESVIQQITREGREGSIRELQNRINYLEHVKRNPTKSMPDSIKYMYKEIDSLGGFVTIGVDKENITLVRNIHDELVQRKVLNQDSRRLLEAMMGRVSQRIENDQVMPDSGICLALAPDNSSFLVMDVPKRQS